MVWMRILQMEYDKEKDELTIAVLDYKWGITNV